MMQKSLSHYQYRKTQESDKGIYVHFEGSIKHMQNNATLISMSMQNNYLPLGLRFQLQLCGSNRTTKFFFSGCCWGQRSWYLHFKMQTLSTSKYLMVYFWYISYQYAGSGRLCGHVCQLQEVWDLVKKVRVECSFFLLPFGEVPLFQSPQTSGEKRLSFGNCKIRFQISMHVYIIYICRLKGFEHICCKSEINYYGEAKHKAATCYPGTEFSLCACVHISFVPLIPPDHIPTACSHNFFRGTFPQLRTSRFCSCFPSCRKSSRYHKWNRWKIKPLRIFSDTTENGDTVILK